MNKVKPNHVIRVYFILVFCVLVWAQAIQSASASHLQVDQQAPPFTRLHAQGNLVKDSLGNTVILRGASVFTRWQYAEAWENYDPLNSIEETPQKYDLYKQTGANFVRVQLNIWLWDNAYDVYTRAIDTLVGWCSQRGIMVVLTFQGWHDDREGYYRDWTKAEQVDYIMNGTMQAFMTSLAERYKTNNTVIGFEIMPERPSDTLWASLQGISTAQADSEYHDALVSAIRAIHAVSPDFLVFVYPPTDDDLVSFLSENPINEPNVVYAIMRSVSWDNGYWQYATEYYAGNANQGSSDMEQAYKSLLFNAMDLGYPVMLMETEVESNLANPERYVSDLFTLLDKYEVGYSWWSYDLQDNRTDPSGALYLFLLDQSQDATPQLSAIGSVWAQFMNPSPLEGTTTSASTSSSTRSSTTTSSTITTTITTTSNSTSYLVVKRRR